MIICIQATGKTELSSTSPSTNEVGIKLCEPFCIENCKNFYEVQPGKIAIEQGISYENLLFINNNFENQFIYPGMIICIDKSHLDTNQLSTASKTTIKSSSVSNKQICEKFCIENCNSFYKVQPGDYPNRIALEQGISYENLLLINNNF